MMAAARASEDASTEGSAPEAELPAPDAARRISLNGIVKDYDTPIGVRRVLDGISFDIAMGEKIAVLGRNGAGKTTLVRLIGGVELPTLGTIERGLFMSWPIAFSGGFSPAMSGLDNIRFISRLYDVPFKEAVAKIDDFAELGRLLHLPVKTYSSGMRARLAFGLTLAVDFECFLVDEVIAVGDQRFQRKCHDEIFVKRKHCSMIMVSHNPAMIRSYCNKALVLKRGRGVVLEDVDLALKIYETL